MITRSMLGALVAGATLVAACAGGDEADVVAITAADDACLVGTTDLAAGKTTFRVQNDGGSITEVYVYAPGDQVVTERENIGPGTSVNFTVDLAAGDYEIACKPGQVGDGIRQAIEVTGAGGTTVLTDAGTEVALTSTEYEFTFADEPVFSTGDIVEFTMVNDGDFPHEFEVFGPDGAVLGEIGPTDTGASGTVILELAEPGTYEFICDIEDHRSRGMTGTFTVE